MLNPTWTTNSLPHIETYKMAHQTTLMMPKLSKNVKVGLCAQRGLREDGLSMQEPNTGSPIRALSERAEE